MNKTLKNKVEELLAWARANFLLVEPTEEPQIFNLPGLGMCYLVLPVENRLLDEDMCFIFEEETFEQQAVQVFVEQQLIQYFIFCFGTQWYYCKPVLKKDSFNEDRFNIDFLDLKYVGTNTLEKGSNVVNHIGIHTEYEMLNGNGLKNYVKKAKFFGCTHVGMCDKNTLAGTLAWQSSVLGMGLKSVIGETIDVATDYDSANPDKVPTTYEIKLYVASWEGWQNLLEINKQINVDYKKFIPEPELIKFLKGLICIVGCDSYLNFAKKTDVLKWLAKFKNCHNRYFQLDCSEFYAGGDDRRRLNIIQDYLSGNYLKLLPPILIQDIYYCDREMYVVKEYLNKVAKRAYDYSEDQYFKAFEQIHNQMSPLFANDDSYSKLVGLMLENLQEVCDVCGKFNIETGERRLPEYEDLLGRDSNELFMELVLQGFQKKVIDKGLDVDKYLERLQIELEVVREGTLESFFLILWDIMNWCAENGIMTGPARGSAAGSLLMHCLGITDFDPIPYDLLFERFLNRTRVLPQIKYLVTYDDGTLELIDESRFKELNYEGPIEE